MKKRRSKKGEVKKVRYGKVLHHVIECRYSDTLEKFAKGINQPDRIIHKFSTEDGSGMVAVQDEAIAFSGAKNVTILRPRKKVPVVSGRVVYYTVIQEVRIEP